MIRVAISLICLWIAPVIPMLLFRLLDQKLSFAAGYVCGVLGNITVFSLCIQTMAEKMAAPGMRPIKVTMAVWVIELLILTVVAAVRCIRAKKWLGISQLFSISLPHKKNGQINKLNILIIFVACLLWLFGACSYLRYVPRDAVRMMADINRIDFFGVTNGDAMVMLGYYFKQLCGISQADAICLVIPLGFYAAFAAVMWEMAGTWFDKGTRKFCLCFFAEAVLLAAGDCLYSIPFFVLHGLNCLDDVLLVLCVPMIFIVGWKLYLCETKLVSKGKILAPGYCFAGVLSLVSAALLEQQVFVLCGMSVLLFVLLFAGRRYLPWLKSSKS
jgi:hypothetical protein